MRQGSFGQAARRFVEHTLWWEIFVVAEWYAGGRVLGLVLPGDPVSYAAWIKVAIVATYSIVIVVGNYALRRHLLLTPRT